MELQDDQGLEVEAKAPRVTAQSRSEELSAAGRVISLAVFWALVIVWVVAVVFGWQQGGRSLPFGAILTSKPPSVEEYPRFLGALFVEFDPPDSGPSIGDSLIRFGDHDLKGLAPMPAATYFYRERPEQGGFQSLVVTYRRAGSDAETTAQTHPHRLVRWFVAIAFLEGVLAIFVRLRAINQPATRTFSVATLLHAIVYSYTTAESLPLMYVITFGQLIALTCAWPQTLRCILLVPPETAPESRWPYRAVWISAIPCLH
ncbi:MAG: hypothetical protein HY270_10235 [Deltaproteobacteria bacterium]|nr:hypothetical protein [Deltaproteobacteria bacterium]